MKKVEKFKLSMTMAVCFIVALFATSCSNDDFFGFDDEGKIDSYAIATSQEYINYQEAYYMFLNDALDIDTTKMEIIRVIDGRPVYAKTNTISFLPVIEARDILLTVFPEYEEINSIEAMQINEIAISRNVTLRNLSKNNRSAVKRTKSGDPEYFSDARTWLITQGYIYVGTNNYYFPQQSIYMTYGCASDCQIDAVNNTIASGLEFGGMAWSDGSGILITDVNATQYSMHWPLFLDTLKRNIPHHDFHVHPNGSLFPSDADWNAWENFPHNTHLIFNTLGGSESYYW